MADVFISYSTGKADNTVQQIADALDRAGISCWYMGRDSKYGTFAGQIAQEIFSCHVFILILDERSNESGHVQNEVGLAFRRFNEHQPITILPFKIDGCVLSADLLYYLNRFTITSAIPPTEQRIQDLIEKVANILRKPFSQQKNSPEKIPPNNEPPTKIKQSGTCGQTVKYTLDENGVLTISGTGTMENYDYDIRTYIGSTPWWDKGVKIAQIENGVTAIGRAALFACVSLNSVSIPHSVTAIKEVAFSGCESLKSISIPSSVTTIEKGAFDGCRSLTNFFIPEGLTAIEGYVFGGCSSLTNVYIPDGVKSIGDSAFSCCSSLTEISIPNSVKSIGNCAFARCTNLESVRIPHNVTTIGYSAFDGCSNLTDVSIPDSVTELGSSAFESCGRLTSVNIPDSIHAIQNATFLGCHNLMRAVVPENIKIGDRAFPDITLIVKRPRKKRFWQFF